ncbi:F-box only protein 39-like [Aplysia californica]|uniref:F-box only protein 39-like n=1 Tax=Aplysia californica TaxID=6500 RepID=A0ABM1W0B5_APLCA|nr:F-box only protein 39-like [Aplysia californica]
MATTGRVKTYAGALKTFLNVAPVPAYMFPSSQEKQMDIEAEEDHGNDKPWHCLPYHILVTICRFLQERERGKMGAVCRSWREASQNPGLWRSHVFYLYSHSEAPRGLSWLQARGHNLRHATVMCLGHFDKPKEQFLRALQRSDLIDLDLNGTAYWWSSSGSVTSAGRVMARIVRLLKTQRQLEGFQMRQAMLDYQTGLGILDTLAVSSGSSIVRLGLEDFFGDDLSSSAHAMPQRFAHTITRFTRLSELTVNYEYLTDELLLWFARTDRLGDVT